MSHEFCSRSFLMKVVFTCLFVPVASGCSSGASSRQPTDNLTAENLVSGNGASDEIIEQMKSEQNPHNYAIEEDGEYGYIAAISEEDRQRGKAAGDVVMFAFRGITNGVYRISSVAEDGRTTWYYECEKPCRVIKRHLGGTVTRMEYTPTSVIGSAFEDAFDGRLKVKREPSSRTAALRQDPAPPMTTQPDKGLPEDPASIVLNAED